MEKNMSEENTSCCAGPGYASPQDVIKAPRENIVYTICIYTGTEIENLIIWPRSMSMKTV